MTESVGFGQGDSAYYVGETPPQSNPKWTKLDHLDGHENVLGYSGTNSKYVKITKSNFYNNGVGVVPNTLDSEDFEPTATGIIENNAIFWNNFNYFLPNSGVATVGNGGLGDDRGHRHDPVPDGSRRGAARSRRLDRPEQPDLRQLQGRGLGRLGSVQRGRQRDLEEQPVPQQPDGPRRHGHQPGRLLHRRRRQRATATRATSSSTFDPSSTVPNAQLYPSCPAPAGTGGSGTSTGDPEQVGELVSYVANDPAREAAMLVGDPRSPGVQGLHSRLRSPRGRRAHEAASAHLRGRRRRPRSRCGRGARRSAAPRRSGRPPTSPSATTTTPAASAPGPSR